jgi:predicted GNAT family acetyltransferase
MEAATDGPVVVRDEERHRFEARVDGQLAGFAAYLAEPGRIVFTHTEVDPAYEGRGVGSALARGALDEVRAQGSVQVVPRCPFIRGWIDRHPDYADLLQRT